MAKKILKSRVYVWCTDITVQLINVQHATDGNLHSREGQTAI